MKTNKLLTMVKTHIAAASFLLTMSGANAKAQHTVQRGNNNVVARLIRLEVKPQFRVVLHKAIKDYILYSLTTKGNILSEAFYELDNPSVLWIIERWTNKTVLNKISNGARFKLIDSLSENGLVQPAQTFYVK